MTERAEHRNSNRRSLACLLLFVPFYLAACSADLENGSRFDVVVDDGCELWLEGAGTRSVHALMVSEDRIAVDRNISRVVFSCASRTHRLELWQDGELVDSGEGRIEPTVVLPAGGAFLEGRARSIDGVDWRHGVHLEAPDPIHSGGPLPVLPNLFGSYTLFEPECATLLDDGATGYVGGEDNYVFSFMGGVAEPRMEYPGWYFFLPGRFGVTCTEPASGRQNSIEGRVGTRSPAYTDATVGGEALVAVPAGHWLTVECASFDEAGQRVPYPGRLSVQQGSVAGVEISGMRVRTLRAGTTWIACNVEREQRSAVVEIDAYPDRDSARIVASGLLEEDRIPLERAWTIYGRMADAHGNRLPTESRSVIEIVRMEGDAQLMIGEDEWTVRRPPEHVLENTADSHEIIPHALGRYRIRFLPSQPYDGRMLEPSLPFFVTTYAL